MRTFQLRSGLEDPSRREEEEGEEGKSGEGEEARNVAHECSAHLNCAKTFKKHEFRVDRTCRAGTR